MQQPGLQRAASFVADFRCTLRSSLNTGCRCFTTEIPTIFHITHHHAGSQWIHRLFGKCLPAQMVRPNADNSEFLRKPIRQGYIYPTLYLTRDAFYNRPLPDRWVGFVIIRDLRDTLISAYFSAKYSHELQSQAHVKMRTVLTNSTHEDGLLFMLNEYLPRIVDTQASWLEGDLPIIRYEDLLDNDVAIFSKILLESGKIPISAHRFEKIVKACRFERLTKGRARGIEEIHSHERKGIAGDWRNHLTQRLRDVFKEKYGRLLISTAYETGQDW